MASIRGIIDYGKPSDRHAKPIGDGPLVQPEPRAKWDSSPRPEAPSADVPALRAARLAAEPKIEAKPKSAPAKPAAAAPALQAPIKPTVDPGPPPELVWRCHRGAAGDHVRDGTMSDYAAFLARKAVRARAAGMAPDDVEALALPAGLFPHQEHCIRFALKQGRAGIFIDTGLGKSAIELAFAERAAAETNGMALILTPLAVARQMAAEAARWGIEARVIRDQAEAGGGVNICNYDRLDRLDLDAFGAVALDEASILKSFGGKTSRALIDAFAHHRFRMAATATPAPNDHMELGQHAAFLGVMTSSEMLSRFFINDASKASQEWRLKRHAETAFWNWLCSWSRMAQKPSDITGCIADDDGFVLQPFTVIRHRANYSTIVGGSLFEFATSATNMFEIKRQTQAERIKAALDVIGDTGCSASKSGGSEHRRGGESATPLTWSTERNCGIGTTSGREPLTPRSPNTASGSRKRPPSDGPERQHGNETGSASGYTGSMPQLTTVSSPDKAEGVPSAEVAISCTSTIATPPGECGASCAPSAIGGSASSATIQSAYAKPPTISADWWVIWVDTNDEQDAIERELGNACISIRGSQSADVKEELHDAWLRGDRKILISKVSIFGHGMNWQHCCRMMFIGRSFSYESYYQAVRRCWRFGQKRPVEVHLIVAEGEDQIGRVIDRKAADHDRMRSAMAEAMRRAAGKVSATRVAYEPKHLARMPAWIG